MLGLNLRFLRKQRDLTQDEMPAQLGVSRATWSNYENDVTEPGIEMLLRISDFFDVSIDNLLRVNLQDVHLSGKTGDAKKQAESTPICTPISTPFGTKNPKNKDGNEAEHSQGEAGSPVTWALLTLMQRMDAKLDGIWLSVETIAIEKGEGEGQKKP